MTEVLMGLYEDMMEIDRKLEALGRQGIADSPRSSLLRRRRVWVHQQIREVEGLMRYGR